MAASAPALQACTLPATGPTVQLFGRSGSFGGLTGRNKLLSGASFAAVPINGWGFGPGQAAYMSAVTTAGAVVIATTPYTDNQLEPTATTMELGCFLPGARAFRRIVVPSSTGRTNLTGYRSSYGGADIGDVQVVGTGANERVIFVSVAPYHGWDITSQGQLPSFGALKSGAGGSLSLDGTRMRTADDIATGGAGMTVPMSYNGYGEALHQGRGLCEVALLPASGHVVVSQYFGTSSANEQGGIVVLDATGRFKAAWQYPAASYRGRAVKCLVREVETDPTGRLSDERFSIICDAFDASNRPVPFPLQEFSYDARNSTISPVSVPVQASGDGSRMETAKYGGDGTLYVARTRPDGLTADRVAVYRKGHLHAAAPAVGAWPSASWGRVVAPDQFVNGSEGTGLVRSLAVDPKTGALLVAGLSGVLLSIRGAVGRARVTASLDLGLNQLVDRSRHQIGVRKGCVDSGRRALWLPVPQLDMASAYPAGAYPRLDQWLYRVSLSSFLGS